MLCKEEWGVQDSGLMGQVQGSADALGGLPGTAYVVHGALSCLSPLHRSTEICASRSSAGSTCAEFLSDAFSASSAWVFVHSVFIYSFIFLVKHLCEKSDLRGRAESIPFLLPSPLAAPAPCGEG